MPRKKQSYLSLWLDDKTLAAVKTLAKSEKRSTSNLVRCWIELQVEASEGNGTDQASGLRKLAGK